MGCKSSGHPVPLTPSTSRSVDDTVPCSVAEKLLLLLRTFATDFLHQSWYLLHHVGSELMMSAQVHKDREPTLYSMALPSSHHEEPLDSTSRLDSKDDREYSEAAPSDHALSPSTQVS